MSWGLSRMCLLQHVATVHFFYFALKFHPVPSQLGDIMRHLRPGPSAIQAYGGIKEGCCCPTGDCGIHSQWQVGRKFCEHSTKLGPQTWPQTVSRTLKRRTRVLWMCFSMFVSWPNHVASNAASSAAVQEEESVWVVIFSSTRPSILFQGRAIDHHWPQKASLWTHGPWNTRQWLEIQRMWTITPCPICFSLNHLRQRRRVNRWRSGVPVQCFTSSQGQRKRVSVLKSDIMRWDDSKPWSWISSSKGSMRPWLAKTEGCGH